MNSFANHIRILSHIESPKNVILQVCILLNLIDYLMLFILLQITIHYHIYLELYFLVLEESEYSWLVGELLFYCVLDYSSFSSLYMKTEAQAGNRTVLPPSTIY